MDTTIGMLGLETENINAKMFMEGLCSRSNKIVYKTAPFPVNLSG